MRFLSLIQEVNIEEKLQNAPDKSYETGVLIGSMLPFIVLVIIAYAIYYHNKKKANREN
ncbi:hypothetical protein [Pontimicrobium sp. IMCC45349]|uniref:hypothetical protein n=1 Tax=Pontimicrobium sp. IMCC45349 TaxID=3391574 RepID=UPI0039A14216